MVSDLITDSQLFHGSPITRAFFKKRNANWLRKLQQWKIDDARRMQWNHQYKRDNDVGEEEDGFSRLSSLRDIKTLSDRFAHLQARSIGDDTDEDVETGLSASSSPTSVLKNKDSYSVDEDCFCCSKQVTEEEEADYSSDDYSDAFIMFDEEVQSQSNNKSSSTAKPEPSPEKTDQKKDDDCPICAGKMDETDQLFKPCSCAYKMCLFCYNNINENSGLCPGCRKKYQQQTSSNSGVVTFKQRGGDPLPLSSSFQGLDSD